MTNFLAQFPEYERHLREDPRSLLWNGMMLRARLDEVSDLGIMASLDEVTAIGDRVVRDHPKEAKAHQMRASARGAIHDFSAAVKELEEAEKLGARDDEIGDSRAAVALALGRYDDAHEGFSRGIARHATPASLLIDAMCLGHMQKTNDADAQMATAEAAYRDVSPFMISWLYFQRGNLWDRAGDPDKAKGYYRIAVQRLPAYAHAVGHLSELLPATEAKPLLEKIIETADDPEYQASLALVEEELAPGSGSARREKAAAGYDALMKKYPLAFGDHAGWFYLNVAHDPARALAAAKVNFGNRKTPDSYELMIASELAAKKEPDACKHADEALGLKYPTSELRLRAAEAYEHCGKKDAAEKIKAAVGQVKTGGRGR